MIYDLSLEAQVLSGLMSNPNVYPEIATILQPDDFYNEVNECIFKLIRSMFNNRENFDKVLLGARLTQLSLGFKDDINPIDYIENLSLNSISPKVLKQTVAELKKISLRRSCYGMGKNIIKKMNESSSWTGEEIRSYVDKITYHTLDNWNSDNDIIDLFDGLYEEIEYRGNNPVEEVGIPSPYPEFNRLYGGFKPGDVYVFCARPKMGKSTWLNHTGFHVSNLAGNKIPCLILDTEMGQDDAVDVKFRLASSLTGIDPWYFSTGNWRKNESMVRAVREEKVNGMSLKERMAQFNLHYRYLADASIDKIVSTVKKWYYSHVGRGKPCVIVYDYIKMADDENKRDAEHQAVGKKVNRLKELVTTEINAPLLTAVQLNRQGDTKTKGFLDSTSSISISDRILWFASYVAILRRKTLEEIAEETDQFGTHKLITLESRFVGRDGGHNTGVVKKPDGSLTSNFINFSFNNFNVKEVCGAEEMYNSLPNKEEIESPKVKNKNIEYNPFDNKGG